MCVLIVTWYLVFINKVGIDKTFSFKYWLYYIRNGTHQNIESVYLLYLFSTQTIMFILLNNIFIKPE